MLRALSGADSPWDMSVAAAATQPVRTFLHDPRRRRMVPPSVDDCGQRRSDNIEGELVEHRLLGRLGVLADEIDLAVRATTMVKAHDVTVGR